MANQASAVSIPQADDFLSRSIDLANLSLESLSKLRTLFHSISQLSKDNTTACELAVIGSHLADEWANTIDCEREDLERLEGEH
ncbi:hypothetical protein ACJJIQ_16555 [Microbulbifer sp. ANSA003]|uniref:hypothetical protein n=1 Tax=Microbulbifer sp. ANSA003 TaxID=3243360 RepID=UPI0040428C4C